MPGAGCWVPRPIRLWAFCLLFNPAWQSRLQGAVIWKINIAFLVQKLQAILLFFSLTKKGCNFSFLGEALCGNALTWGGLANSCWTFWVLPSQTSLSSLSALAAVLKFSYLKNSTSLLIDFSPWSHKPAHVDPLEGGSISERAVLPFET